MRFVYEYEPSVTPVKILKILYDFSVVLLIDTSMSNLNYLVHIQHSIRLLLEQQIANKDYFNIIAYVYL